MSELSYLEKLLDGVEVEWRNLGDTSLFEIANNGRKPVKASLRIAGETPYYGANNIQDYVDGYTHDGEYVLIAEDGSASLENYSIQYATGKFWANNHVHVVRGKERVHSRFLYHYLCIVNFLPFLTGGGRAKLTKGQLIEIPVPIPCPDNPEKSLAIQSEIVRILDKFTALTAELTAELNMRKKQYNYYRDQLLSFKEGEVEWKTLGEIGKWYGGGTPSKNKIEFWENGSIPWISPKDMGRTLVDSSEDYITEEAVLQSSTKLIPANSIAIVVRSSILDKVLPSALIKVPATLNQDMKAVIPHENILVKYIYHMIGSRGSDILRAAKKTGGSVASIDSKKLFSFKIPVPNINEQQRIVEILDKFDTLTNSITEGLPREIELRQKQYEYYRDLLFSFPKPETVSN
ncbi:restriction endonuclease subunit S [Escherichia coli]|uniref:restriction endonuclease subunit S n=1 Tax=Enterobacteriaceae TaxID=543 RepID=UPI000BE54FFA|nr:MULTISPECIES: restriction endonuclease subunit S [Enterobacteriaceae]EBC3902012.1 restriction endonuclease subunit S [Salmonella enterica subsp. enterica serovar Ohio]EDM2214466.1 restriction endonuclease subunit S [Salmonella enterica subsp. enterica serovar Typhimurium]EBB8914807.1 restriction endonuclease subunit S [Salmonella enterica]EBE7511336.1 restriction endonuclease subunit S [Salmonella enterica]EBE8392957.1 restriction endonuclease subunit S [Salmonella enterica]